MGTEGATRCPRTEDELAALLNTRPDGWEYLLYGGGLYIERAKLEDRYRDHVLGYSELTGPPLDFHDATNEAQAAFADAQASVAVLMNMFDPARQERAFGKPGEPGDAALIQHLAKRTIDGYGELMRWARRMRGLRVPTELHEAFRLAAAMMDRPVEEFRDYVDEAVAQLDQMAELLQRAEADPDVTEDDPLVVTLQLTLTIDDEVVRQYTEELHEVEIEMQSQ